MVIICEESRQVYYPVWRSFLTCWLLMWLIVPLFVMVWQHFASRLLVSPGHVTLRRGIFNITDVELASHNIKSIEVKQTLLARILNYGTISIGTSATYGYEIVFNGLGNVHSVANFLKGAN